MLACIPSGVVADGNSLVLHKLVDSKQVFIFMAALCNRADHIYFHAVVCSSSSSFLFLA